MVFHQLKIGIEIKDLSNRSRVFFFRPFWLFQSLLDFYISISITDASFIFCKRRLLSYISFLFE